MGVVLGAIGDREALEVAPGAMPLKPLRKPSAIALRVAEFLEENERPGPVVVGAVRRGGKMADLVARPLNSGFFMLEQMRVARREVRRKGVEAKEVRG